MTADDAFFRGLYDDAGDHLERIPWARLAPRPELVEWLDAHPALSGRALVVACGLGDDAEELARRGFVVTAFDVADTAIEHCRHRFPDSAVDYRVLSLFDRPAEWHQAFDLVVEIWTIQALPQSRRDAVIEAVADTLAPSGVAYVQTVGRADDAPVHDRPWPVSRQELAHFAETGLRRVELDEGPPRDDDTFMVVAAYTRD